MANYTHFYIIRLEFLGFRYHGWQKQMKLKTVQGMVDKTIEFILGHSNFRTLGCGRTDARVSADDFACELFLFEALQREKFLYEFNLNLPPDIRAFSIEETSVKFNIIKNAKIKEYHYYFSFGEKPHPFNAPCITDLGSELNIQLMATAANEFIGTFDFRCFTADNSEDKAYVREVLESEITTSNRYESAYSPKNTFVFKVKSKGFMRYQVRLMMGALEMIGKGKMTLDQLQSHLKAPQEESIENIVPGSGLVLHKVEFD